MKTFSMLDRRTKSSIAMHMYARHKYLKHILHPYNTHIYLCEPDKCHISTQFQNTIISHPKQLNKRQKKRTCTNWYTVTSAAAQLQCVLPTVLLGSGVFEVVQYKLACARIFSYPNNSCQYNTKHIGKIKIYIKMC